METRAVVMVSGGIASHYAAERTIRQYGTDRVELLFTDTKMEDEDLYRFLDDSESLLGLPIVRIADGRTPWQVFKDVRYLGNTRIDPCSRILKRELARKWVESSYDPESTVVVLGFDWTEIHRFEAAQENWKPYTLDFPLARSPYFDRHKAIKDLWSRGVEPPRLYAMGFPHNNCGGFCIKQGQAGFRNLLEKFPERYKFHAEAERELREFLGKDVSILRDRRGGDTKPLTLEEFAKREGWDEQDWGGCGCFI